jgi:hypothetical protein
MFNSRFAQVLSDVSQPIEELVREEEFSDSLPSGFNPISLSHAEGIQWLQQT